MQARKNPVVRVVAVVIAVVVAVVVVMQSQKGSPGAPIASSNGAAAAAGANQAELIGAGTNGQDADESSAAARDGQADETEARATIALSVLVLELDMAGASGQTLLDAIGNPEEREGTLTTEQLAAGRAQMGKVNPLSNAKVSNWAGAIARLGIDQPRTAVGGTPTMREMEVDLMADVNEDGTITVDAGFRIMQANGQFQVLAEEWGLPLATRRSASALIELAEGEAMFLRRRFGTVEILVLISAEVMPPKDDGGE